MSDPCPACSNPLTFDAAKVGTTCGGLELRGWMFCAVCNEHFVATVAQGAQVVDGTGSRDSWTLAKGGRSLNCGGMRIRAEGKAGDDVPALMARIQRLPELEREVELLRAKVARDSNPCLSPQDDNQ